jgi:hypothetical protein
MGKSEPSLWVWKSVTENPDPKLLHGMAALPALNSKLGYGFWLSPGMGSVTVGSREEMNESISTKER